MVDSVQGSIFPLLAIASNGLSDTTMIDFLEYTATEEAVSGGSDISEYKMNSGVAFTNFVYNNPVLIRLSGVNFKLFNENRRGEWDKGYSILTLELLRLQQSFVPIFLKASNWVGSVRLQDYEVILAGGIIVCNLTFKETPLFPPFEEFTFTGEARKQGVLIQGDNLIV